MVSSREATPGLATEGQLSSGKLDWHEVTGSSGKAAFDSSQTSQRGVGVGGEGRMSSFIWR